MWSSPARDRTQQKTLTGRSGASLGDVGVAGVRLAGRLQTTAVRLGVARRAVGLGATDLLTPGPAPGQMEGEAACRAGEPSGEGEEPSPQGLGGHQLLAQTVACCPAGQVMGPHLHRQPGGVGGETARRADGSTRHRT